MQCARPGTAPQSSPLVWAWACARACVESTRVAAAPLPCFDLRALSACVYVCSMCVCVYVCTCVLRSYVCTCGWGVRRASWPSFDPPPRTTLADVSLVAVLKRGDEVVRIGERGGAHDLIGVWHRAILKAVADVLMQRTGEECWLCQRGSSAQAAPVSYERPCSSDPGMIVGGVRGA